MSSKKHGLNKNKNLNALLSGALGTNKEFSMPKHASLATARHELDVDLLVPGKYQPRKHIAIDELESLSASIKAQGMIQPIIVRPLDDERFEIIAGERRWRAAKLAEHNTVPVIVKVISDQTASAMALIENIQRADLSPVEEAEALARLIDEFELTHAELAEQLGKSRASISNTLRLLNLADPVLVLLSTGEIDVGHAKVLLTLPEDLQLEAANRIVTDKLSVRSTESMVSKLLDTTDRTVVTKTSVDPDVGLLQRNLSDRLGAQVKISHNNSGRGTITIKYNSLDELDGIIEHLQ